MNSIGDRSATSPYGVIRDAQKAIDAGMLKLIDGSARGMATALGSGGAQGAAPVQAEPPPGSTVHVVA